MYVQVRIFEINEMRKFQKILKVKSPYQSEIQGKGSKHKVFREPKFTWVQGALFYNSSNKYVLKVQLHYKSYTSCIMPARTYGVILEHFWVLWGSLGAFFTQILGL